MTIQAGTRLGPYEILGSIGAGGMGEVYRARDTRLERTVAIKVLPAFLAADADFRARFEREAKSISALNHPHICTLHDVGEVTTPDAGVVSYLVMEHLEGETLAARLLKGPLPLASALDYACQIADALDRAHRQGITHRDLKPANVFLLKSGGTSTPASCKLLDFGLAKIGAAVTPGTVETQLATSPPPVRGPSLVAGPLTAQGTILGTFQYMAPEQVEAQDADARSDIWAFGCVLYEMLTGRRAFEGRSQASLIAAILERHPTPVADLVPMTPPALDRLVRTCLEKDPDDRFHTAHDLRLQLQWVREGGSAAGVPAPVVAGRKRRDRIVFGAMAAALAIAAAAAAWWLKPAPVVRNVVARFSYELPNGINFTRQGRRVVAISPDGTSIAFVANQQIYLRRMRELEAQPIRGSQVDPLDVTFSPDGEWLAFTAPDTAGTDLSTAKLRKILVAGGTPLTLFDSGPSFGIRWEDGHILYATRTGIHLGPDAGGEAKTIVEVPAGSGEAFAQPQLVNDGRDVLFSVRRTATTFADGQVVVQSRAGGERRVLAGAGMDGRVLPGNVFVYTQNSTMFAQRLDPQSLKPLGGAVPVLEGVRQSEATGTSHFSLSANGTLAYVPGGGAFARELVWVDRNGREESLGAPAQGYRLARVSPDGTRIAFSSDDADRDIWIWEIVRKTLSRLTAGPDDDNYPVWTRDSRFVVYRSASTARSDMYRRAADGTGTVERLTSSETGETPLSLLPGGTQVLVRVSSSDTGIGALSVFTFGRPDLRELLSEAKGRPINGEISPDGRWLAYQSREASTRDEIYVRPAANPDGGRWQVSSGGGARPLWSPDGSELFYDARGRFTSVRVSNVPAGAPFAYSSAVPLDTGSRIFDFGFIGRTYDISPDGRRFLFLKVLQAPGAEHPAVRVVTHWRDEVEAVLKGK
jgi:eukaryotic-like serine/threonine-protein kinase